MADTSIDPKPTVKETGRSTKESSLKPRRTLNRLALAIVAIIIAALGQTFFNQQSLWDGLLFYGIAVILFIKAVANRFYPDRPLLSPMTSPPNPAAESDGQPPPAPPSPGPTLLETLGLQRGWRRNVGVWLILLAVGSSVISFNFFANDAARPQAWWLYLVGLLLLVCGGLLLTRGGSWGAARDYLLPNRFVTVGLILVIALALFMRLYNFYSQPFGIWYDEAQAGLQARQMLQQPSYRPIFYAPINVTGHLLATYALALGWLGNNIYSMRLVSVLFGLGGVLAAYLFGREIQGPRFGLTLAFLVAVARWHLNFSRIAMTGIDTPFFEFLSLYFLVRLVRYGHLRDGMWAGLSLGFGLMFYTAFRLYVLALVLFAVITVFYWAGWVGAAWRNGGWRAFLGQMAMLLIAGWLVVFPVIKFSLDNSDAFWYRTRQISIFTKRDQANLGQALWTSTKKHLLMFNYQGDKNGRHNLPGEPMLDPAMGLLAVLGFGLALTRTRHPANSFFLLLLPLALAGGILSVDFEAPQSLRSIAVIPAVIYLAGLALAVLGREAEEALSPLPPLWVVGPALILAAYMVYSNAHTYFVRQANDFASWNAFSAPETITGQKMARLGPDYLYLLSPFLANHPTTRFIAPDATRQRHLNLPDALPVREPPDRPVALFIHPDDRWVFEKARELYPTAEFEIASGRAATGTGPPVVYFVNLQPADLAAIQGLDLRYLAGKPQTDPADPPQLLQTERALTVQAAWPQDSPVEAGFVAEWQGILYAPRYGPYSFRLVTPGPGQLEIDGNLILDSQGEQLVGLPLAEGNHTIRIRAESAPGDVALYWQPPGLGEALVPQWALYGPPVSNHGLQGSYYANETWAGQPAFQRIDPYLDTYFHFTPLNRPYTVEWLGVLDVPQSGIYQLGLRAVPEAQLYLDGQLLVTTAAPDQRTEVSITLEAGLHDIRILYRDNVDRSRIHLFWTTPSGEFGPIPSQNLWPPLGRYPETGPAVPQVQTQPVMLTWVGSFGGPGSEPGQFFEPRDLTVLSNGNLAVADTRNRRVQLLDPLFQPIRSLTTGDDLPFEEPLAVDRNSRDELLVLDSTLQWIYRYDTAGNFIDRFGGPSAYLFHPRGLTVFEEDTVAVADTGQSRIAFFTPAGVQAGSIGGGPGSGPGQLDEPTDVLRDQAGTYFVAEAMNNRIQRLDSNGNSLNQWTIPSAYAFDGPHIAFGPDGSIFVTESQSSSLLRYAPDGTLLDHWQTIGPVNLAAPVGLYFDQTTNQLYVTDVRTHQIHLFAVETTPGSNE